jgi:hypothetical protein
MGNGGGFDFPKDINESDSFAEVTPYVFAQALHGILRYSIHDLRAYARQPRQSTIVIHTTDATSATLWSPRLEFFSS